MIYGSNILSLTWQVIGGSLAGSTINLDPGGVASQSVSVKSAPDYMLLSVAASSYDMLVEIQSITSAGFTHTYNIPLLDTGQGLCVVDFPTVAQDTEVLKVTIKAQSAASQITDIALLTPKLSDVDLTEILDKIPRLLSDHNTSVAVAQEEDLIALISAYISETTELIGNLNITYEASEPTLLTIRIKDNDVAELYTPIHYRIKGKGSIAVPHAYLNKTHGYHNFSVTAQAASGTVLIDTRRLIYGIDGGRIAYNILDVGSTVYDLTYGSDNTIYAACIDEGILVVKHAEYSDQPGAAWIAEINIGPAIDAAMEYDGVWVGSTNGYDFVTEAKPWVAWVTPGKELKVMKLGSDAATLTTGVDCVAAIRGYENILGEDHGLLLVYVKASQVYYRGYCTRSMWDQERALTDFVGTAVNVNAFRTNDYRVGISVLDNLGATHTYITHRNWAGMASPAENISATITDLSVELTPVAYHNMLVYDYISTTLSDLEIQLCPADFDASQVVVVNTVKISAHRIKVTFSHDLLNVSGSEANFTFPGKTIGLVSVGNNAKEILIDVVEPLPSFGAWTVTYKPGNIRVSVNSVCKPLLTYKSIGVQGEPPSDIEQIKANITDLNLSLIAVNYRTGYTTSEQIKATIVDLTMILTKVGSNPL